MSINHTTCQPSAEQRVPAAVRDAYDRYQRLFTTTSGAPILDARRAIADALAADPEALAQRAEYRRVNAACLQLRGERHALVNTEHFWVLQAKFSGSAGAVLPDETYRIPVESSGPAFHALQAADQAVRTWAQEEYLRVMAPWREVAEIDATVGSLLG